MDFTPITTQEEFDAAIKDRLERERRTIQKEYADHGELQKKVAGYEKTIREANEKIAGHDKVVGELNARIKGYETASAKTRIALDMGLPYEMASRLTGETEDDIRKDAEGLLKLISGQNPPAPPLASTEPKDAETTRAAFKQLKDDLLRGE